MPNTNLFVPEDLNIALKIVARNEGRSVKKEILDLVDQMIADYLSKNSDLLEETRSLLNGIQIKRKYLRGILTSTDSSIQENSESKKVAAAKEDQSAESE